MTDIAQAAGVSRAAVSYVLNGRKTGNVRLSEETVARIVAAAPNTAFSPITRPAN